MESGNARKPLGRCEGLYLSCRSQGSCASNLPRRFWRAGIGTSDEALQLLRVALLDEDQSYLGYRLQSQAYGKLKRYPEADLSAALASFHQGDVKKAKMLAERAKNGLQQGTPGWVKADDIVNFKMEKVRG